MSTKLDPVDLAPAYSIAEASRLVHVGDSTLRYWTLGRPGVEPVIQIAQRVPPSLSFLNLLEAHALRAITQEYGIPYKNARSFVAFAQQDPKTRISPLLRDDIHRFGDSLVIEYLNELVDASHHGQGLLRGVVQLHMERIDLRAPAGKTFYPWPLAPGRMRSPEMDEKPIQVNPHISFGRPCLRDTRIPLDVLIGRHEAGESVESIATDYERDLEEIERAVKYFSRRAA